MGMEDVGDTPGWVPSEGWTTIRTEVDVKDSFMSQEGKWVRVCFLENETDRIIYQMLYSPEVARVLAQALTVTSYKIEDAQA